jgi:hypothetical protein
MGFFCYTRLFLNIQFTSIYHHYKPQIIVSLIPSNAGMNETIFHSLWFVLMTYMGQF